MGWGLYKSFSKQTSFFCLLLSVPYKSEFYINGTLRFLGFYCHSAKLVETWPWLTTELWPIACPFALGVFWGSPTLTTLGPLKRLLEQGFSEVSMHLIPLVQLHNSVSTALYRKPTPGRVLGPEVKQWARPQSLSSKGSQTRGVHTQGTFPRRALAPPLPSPYLHLNDSIKLLMCQRKGGGGLWLTAP